MTSVITQSNLKTTGHLKVELVYPDRRELWMEDKNLIVHNGKLQLLAPLYTPGLVADPIASLHAGNGGTVDPQGLFPRQVDTTLTHLFNEVIAVAITQTVDPTRPSVTFLADITEAQCNGQLINEAALYSTSGNMFNIKTFGGIPKTSAFSVHFEWTISVL